MHYLHRQTVMHSMLGFSYIGVLVAVAIMGALLGATMEVWHTAMQREKERELLFIGNQFRQALGLYYHAGNSYPAKLGDLVKDPRYPEPRRYLRKIYHDPMTGDAEWGVLLGAHGEIIGVHSLSDAHPIKTSGFAAADRDFDGAEKYSDWVFSYQDQQLPDAAGKTSPSVAGQGSKVQ